MEILNWRKKEAKSDEYPERLITWMRGWWWCLLTMSIHKSLKCYSYNFMKFSAVGKAKILEGGLNQMPGEQTT